VKISSIILADLQAVIILIINPRIICCIAVFLHPKVSFCTCSCPWYPLGHSIVSHIPSYSIHPSFIGPPSGSHSMILHGSLFCGILFTCPNHHNFFSFITCNIFVPTSMAALMVSFWTFLSFKNIQLLKLKLDKWNLVKMHTIF
jgi:hypothetical protein